MKKLYTKTLQTNTNAGIIKGLKIHKMILVIKNAIKRDINKSIWMSPMITGGINRFKKGAKGKIVNRLNRFNKKV